MAKKKRQATPQTSDSRPPELAASAKAATKVAPSVTHEAPGKWVPGILALMAFITPTIGAPVQELMQNTLKATVVALATTLAAFIFFWQERERRTPMQWHTVLWFPTILLVYALGSMVWSHTALAALDAARWLVFGLIVWLGANTLTTGRLPQLIWGVHLGAVGAAFWAVLQFWLDFKLFAQGPNPGSTFVNRNFFAEFMTCAIPFGALLLARARSTRQIGLLAFTNGLTIVSLMMTGTRGALVGMLVNLLLILPIAAWQFRAQLALSTWSGRQWALAACLLIASVAGLGSVPTGNPKITAEMRGTTALERAVRRTSSIDLADDSLSYRFLFLKETGVLIKANPLTGVGAGAWEVDIARYQNPKVGIDNHGYPHNDFVQLIAEYGAVGWLALLLMLGYLLRSAWQTFAARSEAAQALAPFRTVALCSVFSLFVSSAVGFPWHLTATITLFALSLAILAATDVSMGQRGAWGSARLPWSPAASQGMAVGALMALVSVLYTAGQTASAEHNLVMAVRYGGLVTESGDVGNAKWNEVKTVMLGKLNAGIALAPHYRTLIEPPTKQLTQWRDWKNAAPAWAALSASRPYSVSLMASAARAFAMSGDTAKAQTYIDRIRQVRPDSLDWMPLAVIVASQSGNDTQAVELARNALQQGVNDFAMLGSAFEAAWRTANFASAQTFMRERNAAYPTTRQAGLLLLGSMYTTAAKQPDKALVYFKEAVALSPAAEQQALLPRIPAMHWAALGFTGTASKPQTGTAKP